MSTLLEQQFDELFVGIDVRIGQVGNAGTAANGVDVGQGLQFFGRRGTGLAV